MRQVMGKSPQDPVNTGIPAGPMVEQTVTTKTIRTGEAIPPVKPVREKKDHINTYYARLDPQYRKAHTACYLYRVDPNIVIVPDAELGEKDVKYIWKFKDEEIEEFCKGSFLEELQGWVKNEYGGGPFQIKVNDSKVRSMMHCLVFKNEGPPRLAPKETFANGPTPVMTGSESSLVPMLMKLIDDKLAGIRQGSQDPSAAVGQVTQVLLDSQGKMFQWMLDHRGKDESPEMRLSNLKSELTLIKEMSMPAAPTAPVAPPKSIVEQLQEFNMLQETINKMKNGGNEGPGLAAQIAEGIAKAGLSGRSKGTDYMPLLIKLGEAALPALAPIGLALAEKIRSSPVPGQPGQAAPRRIAGAPGQPAAPAQQFTPPAGGVAPAGGPMPGGGAAGGASPGAAHGVPVTAPGAQPVSTPPTPAAPVQHTAELTQDDVNEVNKYTVRVRMVDMLKHDREGADAAASIQDMFPDAAVQLRFANVEMLKNIVAQDPILKEVKDDPRLDGFLQSFFEFFHPSEEEEEKRVN